MHKIKSLLIILFISFNLLGQVDNRVANIENRLELLKVDHPQFEEKVNVNLSNTTLSNLLLAISQVHGININVSPELQSINIINNFSNVSIEDLLVFLAREHNLDIQFTGNILSVTKFREPITQPLEKQIIVSYLPQRNLITLDLKNDPLERVFRKITDVSGKNLVFAPGMENLPLSAYLSNVPFDLRWKNWPCPTI